MIRYLSTRRHAYTLRHFLDGPGAAIASRFQLVSYEEAIAGLDRPPSDGAWIFTDYDRLTADESVAAARLWRRLADSGARVLNHPTRSLRRFALLRRLRAAGINDFDAHHVTDLRMPERFPVFIRRTDAHSGPASRLLADETALLRTLDRCVAMGWPFESVIMVEYQDTREPDGLYRKHGVLRIADRYVPVQVLAHDSWINKRGAEARWTPDQIEIELDLIRRNPHRATIERAFQIAGVEYGRIDFGVSDGRIQVWEINCNPDLAGSTLRIPARAEAIAHANAAVMDAFVALDEGRP
ncbi:MAG: hypothetical protein AB7O45_04850 [Alphaproteobacteria bacterium]